MKRIIVLTSLFIAQVWAWGSGYPQHYPLIQEPKTYNRSTSSEYFYTETQRKSTTYDSKTQYFSTTIGGAVFNGVVLDRENEFGVYYYPTNGTMNHWTKIFTKIYATYSSGTFVQWYQYFKYMQYLDPNDGRIKYSLMSNVYYTPETHDYFVSLLGLPWPTPKLEYNSTWQSPWGQWPNVRQTVDSYQMLAVSADVSPPFTTLDKIETCSGNSGQYYDPMSLSPGHWTYYATDGPGVNGFSYDGWVVVEGYGTK